MSSERLATFLQQHDIKADLLTLPDSTTTVVEAAGALGTTQEQIVKSVLVIAGSNPVLVIANGADRIDARILANHLGVSKKRIRLADPPMVFELTGFEVGAVPPFGHKHAIRTLVSERVLAYSEVYAGGGAHNRVLKVAPSEILRVTEAQTFGQSDDAQGPS